MQEIKFSYTTNNKISKISYDDILVNQIVSSNIDDPLIEVYLRRKESSKVNGLIQLSTNIKKDDNKIIYYGSLNNINYSVSFRCVNNYVYIDVDIKGIDEKYDLLYTMDVGLGLNDYIQTNEAYASQYINHKVIEDKNGKNLVLRRTVKQNGKNPFIQIGSLNNIKSYTTDGYQFFKTKYRENNVINNINDLDNSIYQYEFTYIALQTDDLSGDQKQTFYFKVLEDSQKYAKEEFSLDDVYESYSKLSDFNVNKIENNIQKVKTISGDEMTLKEIEGFYDNIQLLETTKDEKVLSFFTTNQTHVVTKEKELNMERNHGHIISSKNMDLLSNFMNSTNYMMGVFGAQNSVGNTIFNQLLTPVRNSLNLEKKSGIRIFVYVDGEYKILTIPSLYEMGLNYSKWYYKLKDDIIIISTYIQVDNPVQVFNIHSLNKKEYNIKVSFNYENTFNISQENQTIRFTPKKDEYTYEKCPNLSYNLIINGNVEISKEIENYIEVELQNNSFKIVGNLYGEEEEILNIDNSDLVAENIKIYEEYKKFINSFDLSFENDLTINKFNTLIYWYVHNALIHYSMPRGLEQYKGGAWGTRDVLQGPFELFISLQKFDKAKEILTTVYKSQFFEDGNWSQWFMFDQYQEVAADESHGDVVVWPLRTLAKYLKITGDRSILDEEVEFKKRDDNFKFTNEKYTILDHVKKQIQYIENSLIKKTHLPSYGDGDWDDTLQPKDDSLRKTMVSGWTSALLYEALSDFKEFLDDNEFKNKIESFSENLKKDYKRYIIKDNIAAGFINFDEGNVNDNISYLLHPKDEKTGIKYRLLPINRGIISELFEQEQINNSLNIIDNYLRCNDGIRLMDKPANYDEGFNHLFQRAEQASTVGREVGLQYVHAHIRYVEAMAKLGIKNEVLSGLNKINPIDLDLFVKKAMYKQRNSYFSSSEGDFKSRYEYAKDYEKLKTADVKVKSGWRIYSSGPGIYINQLISNFLGIKVEGDEIIFDPCIEDKYSGLQLKYNLFEKDIVIKYVNNITEDILINDQKVKYNKVNNKYKDSSISINIRNFKDSLTQQTNEIYIKI